MPEFNAKEFIESLQENPDPEAVDAAFGKNVFSLPAAERVAIGNALDKEFVSSSFEEIKMALSSSVEPDEYKEGGYDIREGAECLKQVFEEGLDTDPETLTFEKNGKPVSTQEEMAMFQRTAQIAIHIRALQDNRASPLLKAYADAANNLTDAEYNSLAVCLKPMIAVVDAFARNPELVKPKANPLRKNTPPAP